MGHSPWGCKDSELDTNERLSLQAHVYHPLNLIECCLGFPGGSVVKNPPANAGGMLRFLCQEDPLLKEMTTDSSILACKIR